METHAAPNKDLKEIPQVQLRAAKPSLERIFAKNGKRAIAEAYDHGYRLHEIAAHLGVHYATVSRSTQTDRAKELTNVAQEDLTPHFPSSLGLCSDAG